MKRKLIYVAVMAAAIMVSCNGKKTAQNEANNDSTSIADTTVADENVDLATVAGTYEGTLPAADYPGNKTVLTLNAKCPCLKYHQHIATSCTCSCRNHS